MLPSPKPILRIAFLSLRFVFFHSISTPTNMLVYQDLLTGNYFGLLFFVLLILILLLFVVPFFFLGSSGLCLFPEKEIQENNSEIKV